jgi:hypothetical protein
MPDDALKGVKILYRLARNAHGGKIMPWHPGLIMTTDETTIFIFAGVLNRKKELDVWLKADIKGDRTLLTYIMRLGHSTKMSLWYKNCVELP